jgi:hypothetical protein
MTAAELKQLASDLDETQSANECAWEFPFYKYSAETREREDAWIAAEMAAREQIDDLIREWADNDEELPSVTDQEIHWINLRFRAGASLLFKLVLDDDTTIFSVGELTRPQVAKWVLIDWWAGLGWKVAFYEIIAPHLHNHKSEN